VDYNHGSIAASSTDDRRLEKDEEPPPAPPVRDVDRREKVVTVEMEARDQRSYQSPDRIAPFSADFDIKFIQETIVSSSSLFS